MRWARRQRQMDRFGLHHLEMIQQNGDQMLLCPDANAQAVELDGAQNQLAQQRRDCDRAASVGQ